MAITINAPTGEPIQFPDGTTDDVIKSVMAKEFPPKKVTTKGIIGAITRGMAPIAAGTALGAAAGAPFAGVGAIPGAAAGALATTIEELGGAAYNAIGPRFGAPRYTTFGDVVNRGLDVAGVERPDTQIERIVEMGAAGATGGGSLPRALGTLGPKMVNPVSRRIADVMAKQRHWLLILPAWPLVAFHLWVAAAGHCRKHSEQWKAAILSRLIWRQTSRP